MTSEQAFRGLMLILIVLLGHVGQYALAGYITTALFITILVSGVWKRLERRRHDRDKERTKAGIQE